MPKLHHEHDTTSTTSGTTSTSHAPSEAADNTETESPGAVRLGDNRNDGENAPSFLFRALSQAANSLWLSFRPRPTPPSPDSAADSHSHSPASSQRCYYTPQSAQRASHSDGASGEEEAVIPSALLSAVLNGPESEPQQGDSPSEAEPSSDDNDNESDDFAAQIRQIAAARAELQGSLAAGIARHAAISRDIERGTRALTVRSLELDNRSLELDTRESLCGVREARLGIDWVTRTRRVCERERAAAATAAELSARFAALETRQQQQDEILKAEREQFWDIQRALSQVIANETDELLAEQRKLRDDFATKSMAAKNALQEMHHAVRLSASTILNGNGNFNPKYLRDVALETRRQFESVNGISAANGWNANSVNGLTGAGSTSGLSTASGRAGASVATNRLSREGDTREMAKSVSQVGMREAGNSQWAPHGNGHCNRNCDVAKTRGMPRRTSDGSDHMEPG